MKERPILFSGPMVRALLDGSKTQTRRIVKGMALEWLGDAVGFSPEYVAARENGLCPYGFSGDRLWVRESGVISKLRGTMEKPGLFRHDVPTTPTIGEYWVEETRAPGASYNVAGCPRSSALLSYGAKACPSIHMPRWASRITLEVTGVRVERLQEISEADAEAEGVRAGSWEYDNGEGTETARESFQCLWDSLAATGADWDANPWVWVVEFKRV